MNFRHLLGYDTIHFVQVKIYKKMEINYLALSTDFWFFEVAAVLRMIGFYFEWHFEVKD